MKRGGVTRGARCVIGVPWLVCGDCFGRCGDVFGDYDKLINKCK